jgi:hypothetical protein
MFAGMGAGRRLDRCRGSSKAHCLNCQTQPWQMPGARVATHGGSNFSRFFFNGGVIADLGRATSFGTRGSQVAGRTRSNLYSSRVLAHEPEVRRARLLGSWPHEVQKAQKEVRRRERLPLSGLSGLSGGVARRSRLACCPHFGSVTWLGVLDSDYGDLEPGLLPLSLSLRQLPRTFLCEVSYCLHHLCAPRNPHVFLSSLDRISLAHHQSWRIAPPGRTVDN